MQNRSKRNTITIAIHQKCSAFDAQLKRGDQYLYLLYTLFFFILSFWFFSVLKEEIIPVSSPIQLKCENDLRVGNIDVTIRQKNTSCFLTTGACTLPLHAIETINETCNDKVVCDVDIRNITNNHSCLQAYGYYNIWYTCKSKCLNICIKGVDVYEKNIYTTIDKKYCIVLYCIYNLESYTIRQPMHKAIFMNVFYIFRHLCFTPSNF